MPGSAAVVQMGLELNEMNENPASTPAIRASQTDDKSVMARQSRAGSMTAEFRSRALDVSDPQAAC